MLSFLAAIALIPNPAGPKAMAPGLSVQGSQVQLVWFEPEGSGHQLRHATLNGGTFGPASLIRTGTDFFVNWADTPSVIRGGDGALWAHWPQKNGAGTYAYDVRLGRSVDGKTWSALGPAHEDGTETEHGFASLWPAPGGVEAAWLDGRQTASKGPMTLRWGRFGATSAGAEIDGRVCDCCGTAAAPGLVAYRDRAHGEIRDIRVARRTKTGWAQTVVHDDGWHMPGCPVNGPAMAAAGQRVAVAWFTGAGGSGRVRVAFSNDGAATFGRPIDLDPHAPLGRVGVVLADGGEALVSWQTKDAIKLRRVAPDGLVGAPVVIASASAARGSGFPRMVRAGGEVVLAWTHCEGKVCGGLRVATLPIAKVPAANRKLSVIPLMAASLPAEYRPNDLAGTPAALPNGPLVLNLWATWCGPCQAELADLAELARARPHLAIVAIAVDSERVAVKARAATLPFTVLHDPGAQAVFGATAIPATRVYDAKGQLQFAHDGLVDPEALERAIPKP